VDKPRVADRVLETALVLKGQYIQDQLSVIDLAEDLRDARRRIAELEGALKDAVEYIDKAHNRMPNVLFKAEAMGVCAELAAIAAQRQKEGEA